MKPGTWLKERGCAEMTVGRSPESTAGGADNPPEPRRRVPGEAGAKALRGGGRSRALPHRLIGGVVVLMLLAAACGGSDEGTAKPNLHTEKGESGLAAAGAPVRGGRLVYGLEAETSGGYCLMEATLAVSGVIVRQALYDTLSVVNSEGKTVPNLAKSISPNAEFDEWTFVIRDGVKFHDGTLLDGEVVKNNLDAWRGTYPARHPALTVFTLANVDTIEVTDPMTVVVKTKVPWVSFPTTLTIMGMMAQAQLDDTESCDSNMIGTGPFKLARWRQDQELLAQRNPDYWQMAPDGKPYPYLDAVSFRPITDSAQRINALEAGEIDAMMTSDPNDMVGPLTDLREQGDINLLVSEEHSDVNVVMLNNGKPPFDDIKIRKAFAMALDRETYNELVNAGFPTIANQPFPPGDLGYVEDPGFPDFDPEGAKALVEEYRAGGGDPEFILTARSDPAQSARAEVIQRQLSEVGINVRIQSSDQAAIIEQLIGGTYQAVLARYYPGGEPDEHYPLWSSKDNNPVNFNKIKSDVIDQALEEGRSEPDPAKRQEIYARISKDFGTNVWNIWLNYTPWSVALGKDVHGVYSFDLPDGNGSPTVSLSRGHSVQGMWKAS
jgi:peptide/nickel transport system substrate-binding protein